MWRGLRRVPALALGLSVPAWAVLAGLVLSGLLGAVPAALAAAAILVLTALLVTPTALSIAALADALEAPGREGEAKPGPARLARRLSLVGNALWLAALRQRRARQEEAERAATRLAAAEAVIAAVPDPLILIDGQRSIVRANAAAAAFVGTLAGPRDLAAGLRNPTVLAAADAVLRGESAQIVEFSVSAPVGRQLRAQFARIDGPSLDGAAAILSLYDITALKRAEEMRADFIANASHELKTPLATLIGFIETLAGPARDDAEARERFLAIMREEAGRMARLVNDLLSLSSIELNEHIAPTSSVALAPLLGQTAAALELRAAERGMRLALALPERLPAVLGDEDELAQVFQNLFDNAIKYGRPHSEVRISADLTATAGRGGAPPASFVRVAVADRGEGIAAEHLPRLTERFYRVDTARSRELGGTGLGLAIVKHILNRHRGRLEIASTIGVGSAFTVWLPATDRTAVIEP